MFTRNWYKALTAQMYNSPDVTGINTSGTESAFISGSSSGGVYSYTHIVLTGGTGLPSNNTKVPYMGVVRTSLNSGGVIFGTGDAAPTLDDYNLSGSLITTVAATAVLTSTPDSEGCTFSSTYTITNSGSADITIKEVGLVLRSQTGYTHLIERTVLASPVTIPAGGVGQVTYTIRMNYPTT